MSPPEAGEEASIVQYWDAPEPPAYISELLDSFAAQSPGLRHRVFDFTAAEAFIGERYSDRELAAFRACAVPAMQADYFRYCAILALGGVYCDADYRCVGDLAGLLDGLDGGELFQEPSGLFLNGFFAFGAPGHPLLALALEIATANIEHRVSDDVLFTTGPGIFTCLYILELRGSIESYLEFAAGTKAEPTAALFCETVGDQSRAAAAFEAVAVSPRDKADAWIETVDGLPYKATGANWLRHGTSIFR